MAPAVNAGMTVDDATLLELST